MTTERLLALVGTFCIGWLIGNVLLALWDRRG